MQDNDLKQLEKIKIPDTSKTAKSRALSAAMEEFDKENSIILKNNEKNSQGFSDNLRPIGNTKQNLWSIIMNKKRFLVGTALAGVVTFTVFTGGLTVVKSMMGSSSTHYETYNSGSRSGGVDAAGMGQVVDNVVDEMESVPLIGKLAGKLSDSIVGTKSKEIEKSERIIQAQPIQRARGPVEARGMSGAVGGMAQAVAPELPEELEELSASADMASPPALAPSSPSFSNKAYNAKKRIAAPGVIAPMPYPGDSDDSYHVEPKNNDKFSNPELNPIKKVSAEPVSTISVDVDTASYSYVRRTLNSGRSINKSSVRVEELINYFDYKYPYPQNSTTPFQPTMSLYPTPWNEETKLLHIGIKGYDIVPDSKPRSNLVFLLDVSGSMNSPDKLPLLKNSLRMLVNNLDENDTVSIVTYAGYAGTALQPTPASQKEKILAALNNLRSGGSTAGAQGIQQAYALAEQNFDKEGVNRIILATDGDFNVGMRSNNDLKRLIEEKRKSGIFLSILGFGRGNYNDALMQTLAQNGNGNAAYIDNINEARKVLVDEASSTLFPIAKDVKIQIEFNPALVSEYRLIGYETRILRRQDFNNDKIDAGDIGSGHTVTAIYEITPVGSNAQMIDELRYGQPKKVEEKVDNVEAANTNEYAFLKMRYKLPSEDTSTLVQFPVTTELEFDGIEQTSTEVRFATAVAAFGQKIRNEEFIGSFSYDDIINLAQDAKGDDKFGHRSEFLNLVRTAKSLDGNNRNHQYYDRY